MLNFDIVNDVPTTNKTILLLTDLDVPIDNNSNILNDKKIIRAMTTINYLVKTGARVVIATHLGNPINESDVRFSTRPIAKYLDQRLCCEVKFCKTCIGDQSRQEIFHSEYGDIVVLENLLFYEGEKNCDINFANQLVEGINIYVNDSFEYSRHNYASVLCAPLFTKATIGLVFANEIKQLDKILDKTTNKTTTAIVGGEMKDKLYLLKNLVNQVKCIAVGGSVANNFLKSLGYSIGRSQFEPDCIDIAITMFEEAKKNNCIFIIPEDVIVTSSTQQNKELQMKKINEIETNDIIVDIGTKSAKNICDAVSISNNVFFYGKISANNIKNLEGEACVINKIAKLTENNQLFSIASEQETILSIQKNNCLDKFSFIPSSPDATLQYMSGKILPGIEVLKRLSKQKIKTQT